MAEKGDETGGGGDAGVKGDVEKTGCGLSVRVRADRRNSSPPRRCSPRRRSYRRRASPTQRSTSPSRRRRQPAPVLPRRSPSPSRRRRQSAPASRLPICASPPRRSISPSRSSGSRGSCQKEYAECASPPLGSISPLVSPTRSSGRRRSCHKEYAQCASPPLCSISPRHCATTPIRRVFPPRSSSRSGTFENAGSCEMEYADQDLTLRNPIGDLRSSSTTGAYKNGGSCQKEYADQNLISRNRSALPRRLDFDEKVYDNGKGENDSENKSQSASKMMSPLEASNSNNLSGKKRLCQTNSQVDSIKTARTSSRCVLGTLCIDLASGTIRKKKQDSHTTCDFVNSEENVNESTSNYKPNKPPKETNAVCPSSGLNHKLFLCPCEMKRSQKLTADIPLTQRKVVPGGDGEADFMIRESAVILDRMIRVVTESHCRDICFKGNLSLENFLMTEDGEMKLMGVESHHISTRGAELDNIKVADIIEFEFFADRKIPPSIEELVRLLRTGERGDERTMSNNISLMPEMERMSLFEWMLKELHKLKAIDPTAHKALKLKLEQRIRWHEWKRKAERNEHLLKILNYRDPVTRVLVSYPDTMEGLLQFIRNSIEHLHKHSYDYATQSSLYYLFEIDHIVSGTFQGLFEILQSVMSASGKLSHWK